MQDKYNLTREENLFIAKKRLIDNIYSGAKVEGVNITFPETQAIIDGINVARLSVDDILVIRNLKSGWKYALNNIDCTLDLNFICKINSEVSRDESLDWGTLRTGRVGIGGTDYEPPVPEKAAIERQLQAVLSSDKSTTEKCIDLYLFCCKKQLFWDGNKRTAFIVANKYLISQGGGLLTIADKDIVEFNTLLTAFYSDDKTMGEMKKFVYDKMLNSANLDTSALRQFRASTIKKQD